MKPENLHEDQLEVLTSTEQLRQFSCVALSIVNQPRSHQVYDDFMWNYHGHPLIESMPELGVLHPQQGYINYPLRSLGSYSEEGTLIEVRRSAEHYDDHTLNYQVVTANVHTAETMRWRVAKVQHDKPIGSLSTTLFLSDRHFESVPVSNDTPSGDVLVDEIQRRLYLLRAAQAEANQPQVRMTAQGCWFVNAGGAQESLAPIGELYSQLKLFYRRFGAEAVRSSKSLDLSATDTLVA